MLKTFLLICLVVDQVESSYFLFNYTYHGHIYVSQCASVSYSGNHTRSMILTKVCLSHGLKAHFPMTLMHRTLYCQIQYGGTGISAWSLSAWASLKAIVYGDISFSCHTLVSIDSKGDRRNETPKLSRKPSLSNQHLLGINPPREGSISNRCRSECPFYLGDIVCLMVWLQILFKTR